MMEQTDAQLILFAMTFFSLGTALGIFIGSVVRKGTETEVLIDKDLEIGSIIHHHTE